MQKGGFQSTGPYQDVFVQAVQSFREKHEKGGILESLTWSGDICKSLDFG